MEREEPACFDDRLLLGLRRSAAAEPRRALYGFHFTGVTANGVPLLELTQPAAVSLLGSFSG
jgi:hypothetical protein